MSKNVYRDGQTRNGYIAAVDRLHDELRFEYRPMLPEDAEFTESEVMRLEPRKAIHLVAAQVAKHVTAWSEVGDDDKPLTVNLHNALRLPHRVLRRCYRILAGLDPSDPDPLADLNDKDSSEADAIIAAAGGNPPGLADVEREAKNSVTA